MVEIRSTTRSDNLNIQNQSQYVKRKFEPGIYKVVQAGQKMYIKTKGFGKCNITNLSKTEYVINSTGEVRERKQSNTLRIDNIKTLRKSFERLQQTIDLNADRYKSYLWITLTYAENMTDTKKLYADCKEFIKRIKRDYSWAFQEYIMCVEPQERGAWHCHLIGFQNTKRYISNKNISKAWGHGFVSVKRVLGVDSLGTYLRAYLTNFKPDKKGETQESKASKKGARLHLYPKGMQVWRHSRGIELPQEKTKFVTEKDVEEYSLTYSNSYIYKDEESEFEKEFCAFQFTKKKKIPDTHRPTPPPPTRPRGLP